MVVKARDLIDRFHAMIRKKTTPDLEPWIADADTSLLASFASGIRRDHAAVRAAIAEPWSNGSDRRADHKAQTGETADVWPWKARSFAG
jgi:transposase